MRGTPQEFLSACIMYGTPQELLSPCMRADSLEKGALTSY